MKILIAVDRMDVIAVADAAKGACDFVRTENKLILPVAETYRFRTHSMYDPELYRPKEEVEEWKMRCPIMNFEKILREEGLLNEADLTGIESKIEAEIAEAVAFAEAGEFEAVEDLMKDVYTVEV